SMPSLERTIRSWTGPGAAPNTIWNAGASGGGGVASEASGAGVASAGEQFAANHSRSPSDLKPEPETIAAQSFRSAPWSLPAGDGGAAFLLLPQAARKPTAENTKRAKKKVRHCGVRVKARLFKRKIKAGPLASPPPVYRNKRFSMLPDGHFRGQRNGGGRVPRLEPYRRQLTGICCLTFVI